MRWPSGIAEARASVASASSVRASAAGDPGTSLACAARIALAATLLSGFPSGLCTRESESSSAVSGETTLCTWPLASSRFENCSSWAIASGVNSSSMVLPRSIAITVNIA